MRQRIYLDNNATTPLDPRVLEVMNTHLQTTFGNPSSVHHFGQESRQQLTQARRTIASYFGTKPENIIFHSGATEGLNTLLFGLGKGHIISSDVEHASVYYPLKELEKRGHAISFIPTGLQGSVLPEDVEAAIRPDTSLITLMAVNNETGVKNPIQDLAKVALRHRIPFVVDAVAALGKDAIEMPQGVSAMVFSAHKLHGPKGVGLTLVQSGFKFPSLIIGGEQEFNRRGGTENLAGIIGFATTVDILKSELPTAIKHMEALRSQFESRLLAGMTGVRINGVGERTVNVSNVLFEGVDGESLLMALDLEGVGVSHGSACSSGALEPSRILLSMGLTMKEARSSLRFSFSRMNNREELDKSLEIIIRLVKLLRK